MTNTRVNRIEISWQQLFKRVPGLKTAPRQDPLLNEVIVSPEIIPIIFVPGIMGSRLKNSAGKKVWDPDSEWFMLTRFGMANAKTRKQRLVGDQFHSNGYLQVDEENSNVPPDKQGIGWGGVAWSFYGDILNAMSNHKWPYPLNICFRFPVYAFGYNWSNSNADSGKALVQKIEEVIKENNTWTVCKQVVLVTHSMGGLVARAACELHGIRGKVLGVVHGTQPATGSPAAYQRMKHGFGDLNQSGWRWFVSPLESIKNKLGERVMGDSGPKITILLANMPGGLELLPNQLYRSNDGSAHWLTYTMNSGQQVHLPEKDPYKEIYQVKHEGYRLVDPAWLDEPNMGEYENEHSAWKNYLKNLDKAKSFHGRLGRSAHPETYQFYATGLNTPDRVTLTSAFAIEPPRGMGDGTVPDSSGRDLQAQPQSYTKGPDGTMEINPDDESRTARDHSIIFKSQTAKKITLKAIENMCKCEFKKETGA